mgnify:CR=1 FL=1|tara:strand:+ start:305 stop:442 length:138 start_codon:yes stop_codon:yes gene_type:complete
MNRKKENLIIKALKLYVFIAFNVFGISALIQLVRFCLNWIGGFNV